MTILNNDVTDILTGYHTVQNADTTLKRKWRRRLLESYARERQRYEHKRQLLQQEQQARKQKAFTGFATAGWILVAGFLAFLLGSFANNEATRWFDLTGLLLVLAGLVTAGIIFITVWRVDLETAVPPPHPLKIDLASQAMPAWRHALTGSLPAEKAYDGATGEYAFIHRMEQVLDDNHFILYRVQQKRGDDVDVMIVGPKGIWIFEVKYWSGTLTWSHGHWQREKSFYDSQGNLVTEPRPISQPPDKQWERMVADVNLTIDRRAPQQVAKFLTFIVGKGGVAFTHPQASYQIGPTCPVELGDIDYWANRLAAAPEIRGWTEQTTFSILDALLTRHHQVINDGSPVSMNAIARQHLRKIETELATRVESV